MVTDAIMQEKILNEWLKLINLKKERKLINERNK